MFPMIAFILVLMMTVGNPAMHEHEIDDEVQEDLNEISELLDEINEQKEEEL